MRAPSLPGQQQASTRETITTIWRQVLARDEILGGDDFFSSGGDSVAMLNMLFKIHETLRVECPPEALFQNPTLAQFIEHVSAILQASPTGAAVASPCTPAVEEGAI